MVIFLSVGLAALVLALTCGVLYLLVRLVKEQTLQPKNSIMEEITKDRCLNLEVSVVPLKADSPVLPLFIGALLMFVGFKLFHASISGVSSLIYSVVSLLMFVGGAVFCYLMFPTPVKGRVIISSRFAVIPRWGTRLFKAEPNIFRLENLLGVKVKRSGRRIDHILFVGRVRSTLKLSRKDQKKYGTILDYLKGLNISIGGGGVARAGSNHMGS